MLRRKLLIIAGFAAVLVYALAGTPPQTLGAQTNERDGQGPPAVPVPADTSELPGPAGEMSLDALSRHIDSVVETQREVFNLPGAAVAVVHRGQVLHTRGYGFADIEAGRPFDSWTVFRTASVSKLLTAIAVMQLVEQGTIDLDKDVSVYVDIPVPDTYPAPVTMRHLLTHTAGFDDRMLGASATKHRLADTVPLREFLISPDAAPRVGPPGEHELLPITYENAAPAGSQFSTADDMARFMLANLGDGSLDGVRILEPKTLGQMHSTAFTHHPLLPGWTLGFIEYHWNGYRLVGHGGDLPGYHNQLSLLPEEELGVFVHFNGIWDVQLDDDPRMHVVDAVFAALVPVPDKTAPPRAPDETSRVLTAVDRPLPVAGNYRLTRHARTSMEKLLLPNSFLRLHVREGEAGGLHINMPLGLVRPSEWVPVSPMVYKRAGGEDYLVFDAEDERRASHLFGAFMIPLAFERVRWYEGELVLLGLMAFSALSFLGVTTVWPIRAALRRIRGINRPRFSRGRRQRVALARAVAGLGATVPVVLVIMIFQVMTVGDTPLVAIQPLLGALTIACGALALWLGFLLVRAWGRGEGSAAERLGQVVVALSGVLFLWQMTYWNVLGL